MIAICKISKEGKLLEIKELIIFNPSEPQQIKLMEKINKLHDQLLSETFKELLK